MKFRATILTSMLLTLVTTSDLVGQTPGQFEIRYDISTLTADQQAEIQPSIDTTEAIWESLITGYQPLVTLDGIDINVSTFEGAPGGTLAQAAPSGGFIFQGGFTFFGSGTSLGQGGSSNGFIEIDVFDFSNPLIVDVLLHETAHTLGFGTLFNFGTNQNTSAAGEYTGTEGLAAYRTEVDPDADFVPLESDNAHFLEASTEVDILGRNFSAELLTPVIRPPTNANNPSSNFISATQLGVFRDLGYTTVEAAAIPEPSTATLLCLGAIGLYCRRRKVVC